MRTFRLLIIDGFLGLLPPVSVVIVHILRIILFPNLHAADAYMHFFGGLSIAWMARIVWNRWHERKWISAKPIILEDYIVIGTVALVGVLWEFWEWDVQRRTGILMQPSITDTMHDLFNDLLGGIILLIAYRLIRRKRKSASN